MGNLLDTVHSPADIKNFSVSQLEKLAQEIRERMILSLSKTGGHLGPNLGVVELTLALHYVFDTPEGQVCFRRQPSGIYSQTADGTAGAV